MEITSSFQKARWVLIKNINQIKPSNIKNVLHAKWIYSKNDKILINYFKKTDKKYAVIVHLYYPESWLNIDKLLHRIEFPFDLFVTLPKKEFEFSGEILNKWPGAIVLEVPNRGRDVLPFLRTARNMRINGYEYILKLHSKKSTHRKDGLDWFSEITNNLLPAERSKDIESMLNNSSTALIGPAGQYVSLSVNFDANGMHMTEILKRIFNKKTANKILQTERAQHGFFAGTMFWARLDALEPILSINWAVSKFEQESGQIDATFAHAMERIFCLVPQIERKNLYEINNKAIKEIEYDQGVIPDWSDVYIGPSPKPKK